MQKFGTEALVTSGVDWLTATTLEQKELEQLNSLHTQKSRQAEMLRMRPLFSTTDH